MTFTGNVLSRGGGDARKAAGRDLAPNKGRGETIMKSLVGNGARVRYF